MRKRCTDPISAGTALRTGVVLHSSECDRQAIVLAPSLFEDAAYTALVFDIAGGYRVYEDAQSSIRAPEGSHWHIAEYTPGMDLPLPAPRFMHPSMTRCDYDAGSLSYGDACGCGCERVAYGCACSICDGSCENYSDEGYACEDCNDSEYICGCDCGCREDTHNMAGCDSCESTDLCKDCGENHERWDSKYCDDCAPKWGTCPTCNLDYLVEDDQCDECGTCTGCCPGHTEEAEIDTEQPVAT